MKYVKIIILNEHGFVIGHYYWPLTINKLYEKIESLCTTITTIWQFEQLVFKVKGFF